MSLENWKLNQTLSGVPQSNRDKRRNKAIHEMRLHTYHPMNLCSKAKRFASRSNRSIEHGENSENKPGIVRYEIEVRIREAACRSAFTSQAQVSFSDCDTGFCRGFAGFYNGEYRYFVDSGKFTW